MAFKDVVCKMANIFLGHNVLNEICTNRRSIGVTIIVDFIVVILVTDVAIVIDVFGSESAIENYSYFLYQLRLSLSLPLSSQI